MAFLSSGKVRAKSSHEDEIADIIENLNSILNSKRDYSFFLPDFGISDFNHLSAREDIAKVVIQEVRENIERFEPRLHVINIVEEKDEELFRLAFRIDCMVRKNSRRLSVYLDPVKERYSVGKA